MKSGIVRRELKCSTVLESKSLPTGSGLLPWTRPRRNEHTSPRARAAYVSLGLQISRRPTKVISSSQAHGTHTGERSYVRRPLHINTQLEEHADDATPGKSVEGAKESVVVCPINFPDYTMLSLRSSPKSWHDKNKTLTIPRVTDREFLRLCVSP